MVCLDVALERDDGGKVGQEAELHRAVSVAQQEQGVLSHLFPQSLGHGIPLRILWSPTPKQCRGSKCIECGPRLDSQFWPNLMIFVEDSIISLMVQTKVR